MTLPVEVAGDERWLAVSRVEFEDGYVFALRDVSAERQLERTRSEFVATASHELRTPIATVYGTFQTLLRPDITLDRERREEFLRLGLKESERLRVIVDDLLLAGQLEGGAPTVQPTRCDVAELVAEVVEAAGRRSDGKHALRADVDPSVGPVSCDPMRLRQILTNLVENAIKYSPDGGTIEVAASGDGGKLRLEVADEGIGIPREQQERIFERFVRLDPSLARGVGGTGLGLYITRELVERMGGRITVRSSEGHGSTFAIALPLAGPE